MDRTITADICGAVRTLNYSVEAMFDMTEKYGNIQAALEYIAMNTKEGFETVRWFAVKMANDGELCRREAGYDHTAMLKEEDITMRMKPMEYEAIRSAVVDAITLGYRRELDISDEEVDLGLLELEQKKTKTGV